MLDEFKSDRLLAVSISPVSATLSAYQKYLGELRKKCLEKLVPDTAAREFYSHLYIDSYFDPLVKASHEPNFTSHGLTRLLMAAFGIAIIVLALALLAASFVLQIAVIYDVAMNPAFSRHVNLFVITFSLVSIASSWLIGLLQLPLPEVDFSNLKKLQALRQENSEAYDAVIERMTLESRRRERIWSAALSVAGFVLTYTVVAVFAYPSSLEVTGALVANAVTGAVLTAVLGHLLVSGTKAAIFRWFFSKYPSDSDERLTLFIRLSKVVSIVRVVVPISVALLFSIATLRVL